MEIKLLEIRDEATFIPTMAVRLTARDEAEFYLLRRAGFGKEQITPFDSVDGKDYCEYYIVLWRLEGGPAEYDPYSWGNRTMANAHKFIIENWRTLQPGQVIDVQFILGETKEPKRSERLGETNIVRTLQEGDRIVD